MRCSCGFLGLLLGSVSRHVSCQRTITSELKLILPSLWNDSVVEPLAYRGRLHAEDACNLGLRTEMAQNLGGSHRYWCKFGIPNSAPIGIPNASP